MRGVVLTYLHRHDVGHNFMNSVLELDGTEIVQRMPIMCGPDSIVESRNLSAHLFLEQTEGEWLWIVDSDMGFAADCLTRLLEEADPTERPIMGALCYGQTGWEKDGMSGYRGVSRATLRTWVGEGPDRSFGFVDPVPVDELVKVDATGAACLLVHRNVLATVEREHGPVWFDRLPGSHGRISEDISFCLRAAVSGFPTHVHTGIRTNHYKPTWISEERSW